ncbi:membrane protein insertion efficiency factor YidD [Pseudomonas sp. OIL-1]|nr:membrane protein insertion efficiency factor YidD [Pseudomonas sp. OIL-1]
MRRYIRCSQKCGVGLSSRLANRINHAVPDLRHPMRNLALGLIKIYRYAISPLMASHCRFYPSCSCYAQEAIEQHGFLRGCAMSAQRLSRCHPWNPGGYDPVPSKPAHRTSQMADKP